MLQSHPGGPCYAAEVTDHDPRTGPGPGPSSSTSRHAAPLIAVIGPTGSGKSALAMALARQLRGEILAVDSMTVYRGMDIGTAKPTRAERDEIPHHGLDLCAPTEEFTVAKFNEMADAVIADCAARGVPLIAVGGTPMYFVSLFKGLFEGPGADEALRDKLRELTNEALHARLTEIDPPSALRIHVNDTKRLIRAIEVFELTGTPISAHQTEWSSGEPRHHAAAWVGMQWDRELLNRRINARAKDMVAAGWEEECLALPRPLSKTAGEAAGYYEIFSYLDGFQTLDDATEQIKMATRQLARRQLKWFRRFENVTWVPGDLPPEENAAQILSTVLRT